MSQGAKPENPGRRIGIMVGVVGVLMAGGFVLGMLDDSDGSSSGPQQSFTSDETTRYSTSDIYSGPSIQRFTSTDAQQLAQGLAEAEKLHGVCFGWKLVDGSTEQFDQGSSRGANIPADTCPRWAEVQVVVANGSGSDDRDAADIDVKASDDLSSLPGDADFVHMGVTADSLVEAPVTVTGQAALGLPLLLVEEGALSAPQVPDTEPTGTPAKPLPPGDGSGSSVSTWVWLGVIVLVMVLALVLGFVARAKQKSAPKGMPPGPPPPAPPQVGPPTPGPPGSPPPPAGPPQHGQFSGPPPGTGPHPQAPPWPPQGPPPPGGGQPPWPPQPPRR